MKLGTRLLYRCSSNASLLILLVRHGSHSDSWKGYLFNEETGETLLATRANLGVDSALNRCQLAVFRMGESAVVMPVAA